jgi:heptaprenyl diphosphate synthase
VRVVKFVPNACAAGSALALLPGEIAAAVHVEGLVEDFAEPAAHVLGTVGKQLRATTVMRSAEAGPRPSDPAVREGAIAVELLHLGTLVHDDVIDDGRLRRGAESVRAAYGNLVSGFLGAVFVARATEMIANAGPEPTCRLAAAAASMCAGQMAEFEDLFDVDRSADRCRLAIAGKTASLFELAAWLGARLSGARVATAEAAARFGHEFGMAFQIIDDVLDLIAPASETGKQQASDLRHGVYNLPIIYALDANADLREPLARATSDAELSELIARIEDSGGIERAVQECGLCADLARTALREEGMPEKARETLLALLERVIAPIATRTAIDIAAHA